VVPGPVGSDSFRDFSARVWSADNPVGDAKRKVDHDSKLFPPQHEFSFEEPSPLGIDEALEEMARQYSAEPTARAVLDDIAFPAT
jgi:hypothetical protein